MKIWILFQIRVFYYIIIILLGFGERIFSYIDHLLLKPESGKFQMSIKGTSDDKNTWSEISWPFQNKKPNAKPKSDVDIEYLIIVSHNVIAFRAVWAEGCGGNLPV